MLISILGIILIDKNIIFKVYICTIFCNNCIACSSCCKRYICHTFYLSRWTCPLNPQPTFGICTWHIYFQWILHFNFSARRNHNTDIRPGIAAHFDRQSPFKQGTAVLLDQYPIIHSLHISANCFDRYSILSMEQTIISSRIYSKNLIMSCAGINIHRMVKIHNAGSYTGYCSMSSICI